MGEKIDEVFVGSCMTNIGHFRAVGELLKSFKGQLPTRLWVAPPTKMDAAQLTDEGTVVSTSTRNFPNRLGRGANVFLASAELAAVAAILGKLPTKEEYLKYHKAIPDSGYAYLNFNEKDNYVTAG